MHVTAYISEAPLRWPTLSVDERTGAPPLPAPRVHVAAYVAKAPLCRPTLSLSRGQEHDYSITSPMCMATHTSPRPHGDRPTLFNDEGPSSRMTVQPNACKLRHRLRGPSGPAYPPLVQEDREPFPALICFIKYTVLPLLTDAHCRSRKVGVF